VVEKDNLRKFQIYAETSWVISGKSMAGIDLRYACR
jgi:hypothetical protein